MAVMRLIERNSSSFCHVHLLWNTMYLMLTWEICNWNTKKYKLTTIILIYNIRNYQIMAFSYFYLTGTFFQLFDLVLFKWILDIIVSHIFTRSKVMFLVFTAVVRGVAFQLYQLITLVEVHYTIKEFQRKL